MAHVLRRDCQTGRKEDSTQSTCSQSSRRMLSRWRRTSSQLLLRGGRSFGTGRTVVVGIVHDFVYYVVFVAAQCNVPVHTYMYICTCTCIYGFRTGGFWS